jgi:hypothetical protein
VPGLSVSAARKFPPEFDFVEQIPQNCAIAALEELCTQFYAPVESSIVSLRATL